MHRANCSSKTAGDSIQHFFFSLYYTGTGQASRSNDLLEHPIRSGNNFQNLPAFQIVSM